MGIRRNDGYTLLEVIITIGLIGIAISASTFGLRTIYNSNINARASEVVNTLRLARTKQMASSATPTVYRDVIIEHDGSQYSVVTKLIDSGGNTTVSTLELPKSIHMQKYNTATATYEELSSIAQPVAIRDRVKTFRFDPSSGKIVTSAHGKYRLNATNSDLEVVFVVVALNGRVYIEE